MPGKRQFNGNTKITVAHTEYIRDITPSQAFTMQLEAAVNPGLPTLFPWLHTLAQNFETYRIIKLLFRFKSTSADAVLSTIAPSGSTSLGSVIMMAQYNVLKDPPQNKREMLNNATAKSCKPSNSMYFSVVPQAAYKTLFTRSVYTNPDLGDRRLYDHCDFHIATEGMQATTGTIGELSVTAIMQFQKPTLVNQQDPLDYFSWSVPITLASPQHTYEQWMLQFVAPTTNSIVQPANLSNMNGYIEIGDQDGYWTYRFPDSTSEQIGAVFMVKFENTVSQTSATDPATVWMAVQHMRSPLTVTPGAEALILKNCRLVQLNGQNPVLTGFFPIRGPTLLDSTPDYTTATMGSVNIGAVWYLEITGPNASFASNQASPTNAISASMFQANGTPYCPTLTETFNKRLTVTRIQYNVNDS